MKNILLLFTACIMAAFSGSVLAQKNKKKKNDEPAVIMSQPLTITNVACMNCNNEQITSNLASSGFDHYYCDSAGSNFYFKLNDTAALYTKLNSNAAAPLFEKSTFTILRNGLHFPYISTSASINPILGLNTFFNGNSKLGYSTVTVYDMVENKSFGKIIFPDFIEVFNTGIHKVTCTFESCFAFKDGDKEKALVIMNFFDMQDKIQYLRGFLLDLSLSKYVPSAAVKKILNPADIGQPNTFIIDFNTGNALFDVQFNCKDEYSGGRSIHGIAVTPNGNTVAVLLSGRNKWGTLYIDLQSGKFRFLEDVTHFSLSKEGKLIFLQKKEGYDNYSIGEINNPSDTNIVSKHIDGFKKVNNETNVRFSPDGRFYFNGGNGFFDLSNGREYYIPSSFNEKSVGETEPLRKKGLSLYMNYTERYIENSQEYFNCNKIAFTPDSKHVLAFYELRRVNFTNPANPQPNADGKYAITTSIRWYIVRLELPE